MSPACAEAHNNLGVLYREEGDVGRAEACYQAALDARPNFPQVTGLMDGWLPCTCCHARSAAMPLLALAWYALACRRTHYL